MHTISDNPWYMYVYIYIERDIDPDIDIDIDIDCRRGGALARGRLAAPVHAAGAWVERDCHL